jgi:hypothetical protein
MTKYISHISSRDFNRLYPSFKIDLSSSSYPQVFAIISDNFPTLPNHSISPIQIIKAKHIYSTRDYWEVTTLESNSRHKIPKRYTEAIYLIEED